MSTPKEPNTVPTDAPKPQLVKPKPEQNKKDLDRVDLYLAEAGCW